MCPLYVIPWTAEVQLLTVSLVTSAFMLNMSGLHYHIIDISSARMNTRTRIYIYVCICICGRLYVGVCMCKEHMQHVGVTLTL